MSIKLKLNKMSQKHKKIKISEINKRKNMIYYNSLYTRHILYNLNENTNRPTS